MTVTVQQPERHSEHIFDVVRRGVRDDLGEDLRRQVDEVVAQSWGRCLNDYRLHPDKPPAPVLVPRVALEERCARIADVIDCARHEMTTLFQQLADTESAVVLTDTDGVIVHQVSSPEFAAEVAPLGLRAGAVWSETEAGTNGMGTCLAAASPVAVRREDHFFTRFTQLTCSAVPVFDPAGTICAVLDVTSRSRLAQQHLLVLLGMTARMIENRLIDQRFRNAHPLHFHSRPEFVYTLHEGRLAVGDDGRILAANRSALFQLGLQSIDEIRSRHIEDLFQTSLEDMLQRSASSSYHPVVMYRAMAAHRFFAVARRPASDAGTPVLPPRSLLPPSHAASAHPTSAQATFSHLTSSHATSAHAASVHAAATTSSSAAAFAPSRGTPPVRAVAGRLPALHAPAAAPQPSSSSSAATFEDPRFAAHLDTARRLIARRTPVLLAGETGSGKEVFARAVHDGSPHAAGAFVAVNCASLPETLIESELFGYRAGAFTGAQRAGRRGKILQADGGTLFLDEIGDMPLDLQARLLRVLDERQVTPLGAEETHPVDFQLLSASHRDLRAMVHDGCFREDLYYRLAGIELQLPPLRERTDRRELIRSVLASECGGEPATLGAEAERLLMDHPWPGNVRQLRHVLRSAAALADGRAITREHLPSLLAPPWAPTGTPPSRRAGDRSPAAAASAPSTIDGGAPPLKLNPIQANERQVLLSLLEQHRWNVSNVAKALDISRNTLYRKLHKLRIEISHPE